MKHILKASVIVLAALSLVACGGSSKSNKTRRSRVSGVTKVTNLDKAWNHFQNYTYICPEGAEKCLKVSSQKPLEMEDVAPGEDVPPVPEMEDHRISKEQYTQYTNCVRSGLGKIDLNGKYSDTNQGTRKAIKGKVIACCSEDYGLEHRTKWGKVPYEAPSKWNDGSQGNGGLTVGDAITNIINKGLYLHHCWKSTPMDPVTTPP